MKNHFILLITGILLTVSAICQSYYEKWISTPLDDYPEKVSWLDGDNILLITHQGIYSDNYYEKFDYTNVLYKTDYELNFNDSTTIDSIGNYKLLIKDVIKSDGDSMLLWAKALHSQTQDEQLCLLWMNNDLNIINDSIYGLPDVAEVISGFIVTQEGNLIFSGSTNFEPIAGDYLLWEFDINGQELNKVIHQGDNMQELPTIIEVPGTQKYHVCSRFETLLFDYNLNFDTLYFFNDTLGMIPNGYNKKVNDFQYLRTGLYLTPPVPGSPWQFEMAFALVDENTAVLDFYTFGTQDTIDNPGILDFITTDTIYFGGTNNLIFDPPENSWVLLYITNIEGEILENKYWGGGGQYEFADILALNEGGYLMTATRWDFNNFPADYKRDIMIVSENYGAFVTGVNSEKHPETKNIFVYPNPGHDVLKINSAKNNLLFQLFDFTGKTVIEQHFDKYIKINTQRLPAGLYFYNIIQNSNMITSGKWVKE